MKLIRHRPEFAIFTVFFFVATVLGHWVPRIPDIKEKLALSDSALGFTLLALPLATMLGLAAAAWVIRQIGLRNSCRLALPMWALLFILPGLAANQLQLMLALAATGMAVGLMETAMNTEAARLENVTGRRLMSRSHGFWSLGSMFGAMSGAFVADAGISVARHFLLAMPVIAVVGYLAASALPVEIKDASRTGDSCDPVSSEPCFRLPTATILMLCIMPLGVLMIEGAFVDWSAIFMREHLSATPLITGITYATFASAMAVVRLSGDSLASRFGDYQVVLWSGIAATLGILLFALASNTLVALFAAVLAGAGSAVVFPLAVTAAANRPGKSAADNVVSLNMIAFTAFFLAPPLVGFLSEAFSLRIALLTLVPAAIVTVLLAGEVQPTGNRAGCIRR
ncbi:MAG: MFS transporter [Granulosicoccus sp.]